MGSTTLNQQKTRPGIVRRFRRASPWTVAAFLALVIGAGVWMYWRSHACLPQLDGIIRVPGLGSPVEVLRDARGVPHLRAHTLEDVVLAQGYVTAQDRLWQMDVNRRAALGELSEVFGEGALKADIESRTLGLRQACERAVADLDPRSRQMLGAYARGVNAFITSHLDRLPIEFLLLGYKPRLWEENHSLSVALYMIRGLSTTWPDELMRERIRTKLGPDYYADLFPDHSPLDAPVAEPVSKPQLIVRPGQTLFSQQTLGFDPEMPGAAIATCPGGSGSNNWVLSGIHTRTGKPLLANDPHLGHSVPSVWTMVHLKAPDLNVSGVTFPGLPFVVIGHNEQIAWGMTNTGPDVQDVYVETFSASDPRKYLYKKEWIDAEVREETVKVRNQNDYHFTVKVTRHGPVVYHEGDRDLSLRWTVIEPHNLRYPFLKINQARDWQEFTAALRDFLAPMQNFVYADSDGNIGYYAAGLVPIRRRGDGTVPVPGVTDEYDWKGYIPFENLPHAYNPVEGIIATANGRVVPDNYPYLVSHKWEAPYRTARIFLLLRAGRAFTVADMLRIQSDIYSLEDEWLKRELIDAARFRSPNGSDAQYALGLVGEWDGEARWDSAATLVCEVTRRALLERILKPKLGEDLSGYRWPMSTTFLENVLRNDWVRWLPPGDKNFKVTLVKSLEDGVGRIPKLVGRSDRRDWKWGSTIPLTFHHRLAGILPFMGRLLDTGPYPQSGTGTTVKQTTSSVGPSMRMVVDLANLDNSVQNITLGESGQVFSPHYRDQFEAWYSGASFPMLFSDSAVEREAAHKLVLQPAEPQ